MADSAPPPRMHVGVQARTFVGHRRVGMPCTPCVHVSHHGTHSCMPYSMALKKLPLNHSPFPQARCMLHECQHLHACGGPAVAYMAIRLDAGDGEVCAG